MVIKILNSLINVKVLFQYCFVRMNPCSIATPQQDTEGDGRWNSIVSFQYNNEFLGCKHRGLDELNYLD